MMQKKVLIFFLYVFLSAPLLWALDSYVWSNVCMGGGGFVSAVVASPIDENLFYARTDVGGAYRWDESSSKWVSIMDWVDVSERGLLGVEAIAVDPQKSNNVYMVAGTSYWNDGRSAFLRSSNRGDDWEVLYTWDTDGSKGSSVTLFNAHGNGMGRGNGEALAVDPNDSDILFYGSKNKGLFKSTDNGSSWVYQEAFKSAAGFDTTWNGSGFSFVTFAPGNSKKIFAGFLREGSKANSTFENVFASIDGGETWNALPIPDSLRTTVGGGKVRLMPQRAVVTDDASALIITFSDGAGPHSMAWDEGWGPIYDGFGRGAVLKYDLVSGVWSDISPEDYIDEGGKTGYDIVDVANENYEYLAPYGGIAINPQNSQEMIVTTEGYRGSQFWYDASLESWKDQWGTNIFHTKDGGVSWIPSFQYYWMEGGVYPTTKQMDANGVDWMFGGSIHWSGSVAFDYFNPDRVWVTSGNGLFVTENINAYEFYPATCDWCSDSIVQNQVWKFAAHGIEETVPEEVVSIPQGPMISVIADYDGFRHDDIAVYPAKRHQTSVSGSSVSLGSTRGLAYAPKSGILVKVADTRTANPTGFNDVPISPIQFSKDSGASWTVSTYESISSDYIKGSVAISTDGSVVLWTPGEGTDVVQRYANSSWSTVSGINGAYVVGDPENADVFYAYQKTTGKMFKSSDKGNTFTEVGTPGVSAFKKFRLAPNREGDIWIPIAVQDEKGLPVSGSLLRSVDGGVSFSTVSNVGYCEAVGFGKAAVGQTYPAVYVYATIGGVTGVFGSDDEGATWTRINDDSHEYGGLANGEFVMGDMNTYGVVYMSTAGRGIATRVPSSWNMGTSSSGGFTSIKAPVLSSLGHARLNHNVLSLEVQNESVSVALFDLKGVRKSLTTWNNSTEISLKNLINESGVYLLKVFSKSKALLSTKIQIIK